MIKEMIKILEEITEQSLIDINEDASLFSSAFGLKARDVLYLFMEIEKRYGVIFEAEKINEPCFFTIKNIASEVEARLK